MPAITSGSRTFEIAGTTAHLPPYRLNLMRGEYLPMGLGLAVVKWPLLPKPSVPGVDVAGTVAAVGAAVTRFAVGEAVYGMSRGSFAQYAAARESKLAHKPASLTFEQAAVVPVSAGTALQALCDSGRLRPGQLGSTGSIEVRRPGLPTRSGPGGHAAPASRSGARQSRHHHRSRRGTPMTT